MQRRSLRARSETELKMLRVITSRSILANQKFDLVEPRRVGRGEVEVNPRILL